MDAVAAAGHGNVNLAMLPNEVLLEIWIYIEEPSEWALVNKRLHMLSKDTFWRAKWFMESYELFEVIFYAIATPRIFTASLLDILMQMGAPLSRNLVQLVFVLRNSVARDQLYISDPKAARVWLGNDDKKLRWGRISFSSYAAVLRHGTRLYGDTVVLQRFDDLDTCVFTAWLEDPHSLWRRDEGHGERVQEMFASANFMPLPLNLELGELDVGVVIGEEQATQAICYMPSLTADAIKNGFELTIERTQNIINFWLESFCDFDVSPEVVAAIKDLNIDGIVYFPQDMAQVAFEEKLRYERVLSQSKPKKSFYTKEDAKALLEAENPIWKILLELDQDDALPYELDDVIDAAAAVVHSEKQK